MIQCPWCRKWKIQDTRMRMQICADCSDAWDPVECNDKSGAAIKRPAEAIVDARWG